MMDRELRERALRSKDTVAAREDRIEPTPEDNDTAMTDSPDKRQPAVCH
jgi:hypothetical protein